ncbi:MAG: methyltransferase [Rubellimicrobium sp.]|nr:methyltransferase [Rubellimicrobium sp.]
MTSILDADGWLTEDAFLGGRLRLLQPRTGYRAGNDPVILAAAVDAAAGQSVLELGLGVGVAALSLAARVPGLKVTGVELQPAYAALARRNAERNALALRVIEADLAALPPDLRQESFDHVMMNPPYFDRSRGTGAQDPGRDIALGGSTPLALWIEVAARRLRPRGWLTLIQRAERLPEVLAVLRARPESRLGSVQLRPLAARVDRDAQLFILRARKEGRAAFRLLAPLVMHRGDRHLRDEDDFTELFRSILRDGAPCSWSR